MPVFTSTTLTTLWRKVASAARHVPKTQGAVILQGRRARLSLRRLLLEAFPSLSTPSHLLRGSTPRLAVEPIRLGTRSFQPLSPHARLQSAAHTFRRSYSIPPSARGGRMVSNVGMSQARGYASASAAGGNMAANAPMALRAFAALFDDDELRTGLPRATQLKGYAPNRMKQVRKVRRAVTPFHLPADRPASVHSATSTSLSSRLADLAHHFPLPTISRSASPAGADTASLPLPITIETLLSPGTTTVLSLPLHPSFALLDTPTPRLPYLATELGISLFSRISHERLSVESILSFPFAQRLFPLVARLEDLGFFGELSMGQGRLESEVIYGVDGQAQLLQLRFNDRAEADVRAILGELLAEPGDAEWYALAQEKQADVCEPAVAVEKHVWRDKGKGVDKAMEGLRDGERREMMEQWEYPMSETIPTHRYLEPHNYQAENPLHGDYDLLYRSNADYEDGAVSVVFPQLEAGFTPSVRSHQSTADAIDVSPWTAVSDMTSPTLDDPPSLRPANDREHLPSGYSSAGDTGYMEMSGADSGSFVDTPISGISDVSMTSSALDAAAASLALTLSRSHSASASVSGSGSGSGSLYSPSSFGIGSEAEQWSVSPSEDDEAVESAVASASAAAQIAWEENEDGAALNANPSANADVDAGWSRSAWFGTAVGGALGKSSAGGGSVYDLGMSEVVWRDEDEAEEVEMERRLERSEWL